MTHVFDQDVLIDGTSDTTQLRVQGASAQTQPLQAWEDSVGNPLARITSRGNFQVGNLGLSTVDALLEANADLTPTSPRPKRGFHALGQFTGALAEALTWVVHELELLGSSGVSTLQTAFRANITNNNTGTITNAELRAGDFQAENHNGGSENAIKQITGIQGSVVNSTNAHSTKAVAFEAAIENSTGSTVSDASAFEVAVPTNEGSMANLYGVRIPDLTQATNNFAIHTGEGVVHFGDLQELLVQPGPPSINPPAGFIKLYPKLIGGVPQLLAKSSDGSEHLIGLGGGHEILVDDQLQIARPRLNFISGRGIRWDSIDDASNAETKMRAIAVQTALFSIDGNLTIMTAPMRLYNKSGSNRVIERVFLSVSDAPTGATIIVDIHNSGTTIFTTQANRPQIAISATTGESTTIDVPNWADGEYLTAEVDQIGSNFPGSNLTVHVVFS